MIVRRAAPWAAALAILGGGGLTAIALADPGEPGTPAVSYVTIRETVQARVAGHSAAYWHWRNTQAHMRILRIRRDRDEMYAITRRLRREAREQARDYRDDYGIRSSAFLCIHRYEGSWTDPNAPYWGGLQMDRSFMATYGGPFYRAWGTADHWPAYIQVAVAEYARLSGRGYFPWPNTARACGLL